MRKLTLTLISLIFLSPALAQPTKEPPMTSVSPCPGRKPNCVSTAQKPDEKFYINPIKLESPEDMEKAWKLLQILPPSFRLSWDMKSEDQMVGIATTKLMKFKDDVVLKKNREKLTIEMRSESRFGYSDRGVNRERLENIRSYIKENLQKG